MVYSALSDDTSTLSQFTRRKAITITTDGTNTPASYQVKLTITYESEMQADFDDLRFNTRAGGYIDYWIESYTASTTATVWVELPDAITDPGSDIIMMYYGSPGLSDDSNGDNTFLQYHGSASSNFLDSLVISSPYIWEGKLRSTNATHNLTWGLAKILDLSDDNIRVQSYSVGNAVYHYVANGSATSNVTEAPSLTTNQWYRSKISNDGTTTYGYFDGNEIGSGGLNTNLPNESLGLFMNAFAGTCEQTWSFVRKYIANEPTPSYGTAQHQRRTPQFIG